MSDWDDRFIALLVALETYGFEMLQPVNGGDDFFKIQVRCLDDSAHDGCGQAFNLDGYYLLKSNKKTCRHCSRTCSISCACRTDDEWVDAFESVGLVPPEKPSGLSPTERLSTTCREAGHPVVTYWNNVTSDKGCVHCSGNCGPLCPDCKPRGHFHREWNRAGWEAPAEQDYRSAHTKLRITCLKCGTPSNIAWSERTNASCRECRGLGQTEIGGVTAFVARLWHEADDLGVPHSNYITEKMNSDNKTTRGRVAAARREGRIPSAEKVEFNPQEVEQFIALIIRADEGSLQRRNYVTDQMGINKNQYDRLYFHVRKAKRLPARSWGRVQHDDALLQEVARLWVEAYNTGGTPFKHIIREFAVTETVASGIMGTAKRKGFVPTNEQIQSWYDEAVEQRLDPEKVVSTRTGVQQEHVEKLLWFSRTKRVILPRDKRIIDAILAADSLGESRRTAVKEMMGTNSIDSKQIVVKFVRRGWVPKTPIRRTEQPY